MTAEARAEALPVVSIIVVNFNGARFLAACLRSLACLEYPCYEVVVVDNASSDESPAILSGFKSVKAVRSPRNRGFAGGNNLGLEHCSGEFILLLNNDTVVQPGFLKPLAGYLRSHPRVGALQGKMRLPRFGGALDVCGSFLTPIGFPYHYGYLKPDGPKYQRSYPVFCGKGACLLFRREVIAAVGGFLFDEDFFCYYEESDFCHRLWLAGYEVHFVHESVIEHLHGATAERIHPSFALRQYLANQTTTLLSNLAASSLLWVLPSYCAVFLAGWLAALCTGRWPQAGAYGHAFLATVKNLKKVKARRRMITRIRRRRDREIFAKIMRMPRLDYFWRTFRGRLDCYVDQDLEPAAASRSEAKTTA